MEFNAYFQQALKFLGIRSRSEKEIRDYLSKILSRHSGKQSASRIKDGSWASSPRFGEAGQDDNIKQIIDLIVVKLKEHKFLNDEEFARMWIRSRTEFKPKGERFIRFELQQKGISKEIIDKAFQAFDTAQIENKEETRDELALARDILEKKRKKFEPMEKRERFNKAGSLLARRGFDLDEIKKAIEEVFGK